MSATVKKLFFVVPLLCVFFLGQLSSSPAQAGTFTLTLTKTQMEPLAAVKCYVFNSAGSYLGISGTSDSGGVVSFNLSDGVYKFRVDYLGYQFWSEIYSVPVLLSGMLNIPHQDVVVRVEGVNQGAPEPMQGLKVYLFTGSGAYQGKSQVTNADGEVIFNLPERSYKVRVDYLGQQFWSEASVWQNKTVPIPLGDSEVMVTGSGIPLGGVKVYVFSAAGSYLGKSGTTDATGKVIFTLPAGSYKYRGDYQRGQHWSGVEHLIAGQTNFVSISTGGGTFALIVKKNETEPLSGLSCYVFNGGGSYLGISGTTDSGGLASFNLSDGLYKFRVDYLGYQFWSDLFNVPASLSGALVIPHQGVVVTVEGVSQGAPEPMQGLKVYLFTASGAYQGQSQVTDINGQVTFNLPEQSYKVRADYLGQQFWSDIFLWQNTTITIPLGDASITVMGIGSALGGVKVYVFSAAGSYLGISGSTDAAGKAVFTLPSGSYQYRADYLGNQYWSGVVVLNIGPTNPVSISTGGGTFALTVKKNETEPLSGLSCYVFNDQGSYLGLSGTSDTGGEVFFDLSDGGYKFRVDYLGYQFWSEISSVPTQLSDTLSIPHQDVVVRVEGLNQGAPEPFEDVTVYLFTASGAYQKQFRVTNVNGEVTFNLPEQSYQVRADYFGQEFWADILPWQNTTIAIPLGDLEVTVHSDLPIAGVNVYVFSREGSYLGVSGTSDANGKINFTLAAGSYRFRADYQGNQYWTGQEDLIAGQVNITRVCTSETRLVPGDGQAGDHFGASVSVSGNHAIIGAPGADDWAEDGGSAYVFSRASSWSQYGKLVAADSEAGDHFGASVSINGAFAVGGAHGDDDFGTDSGSVYFFHHDGNVWTEQLKITAGDARAGDLFGCSVSVSGSSAIVGAEGYDGGQGGGWDGSHLTEFEGLEMQGWWGGDHWESYYGDYTLAPTGTWAIGYRPAKVRITYTKGVPLEHLSVRDITGTLIFGEASGYLSGDELDLNCTSDIGQLLIMPEYEYPWIYGIEFYAPGEPGGEDSGAAYVFRFDGSSWTEQAKLVASDSEAGDHFGASVGLDGDYAIVGAYGEDHGGEDSGCAYTFKFDASSWVEQVKLVATDAQAGARFGASVSISGDYAIVGADSDDECGEDAGAAYIFRRYGSVWTQQAKLTAGDAQAGDHFGGSVSISGSYAAIGAPASDSKGPESGGTYVFKREGANWIQLTKYVSNTGNAGDHFGASVSIGNGYILSGSKDSDDNGTDSGSASIYAIGSYHDAALRIYPETIPLGGSATLSWTSINADSVTVDQGIGPVPLNGSISVSPAVTMSYMMAATSPHGADTNDVIIIVDQPPALTLIEPNAVGVRVHNRFTIEWTDADAEQNAAISLYFDSNGSGADGILIVNGLREDPDGLGNDTYVWDTSNMPEGSYSVYAVIDDGYNAPVVVYSSGVIVVDHDLYPEAKMSFTPAGYNAWIGSEVSLSSDYAIIGAPGDSYEGKSSSGSAYILQRENGIWIEHSKLVASDGSDWDQFGGSVSMSGEYAVVGAYGDDVAGSSSGSAYIFKREGSNWIEHTKLVPNDVDGGDLLGWSVSISGDYAAIGAPGAGGGAYYYAGAAYVFKRNGSAWVQEAKLVASDASYFDQFGSSVCINGDYVIIGASGDSDIAQSGGSAYVFKREGSTWIEQAKLVGSDVGAYDAFGCAVAMDGDYAIVGAPHYDWDPEVGYEPGSAYMFKREGSTWTEQAKLVPMNGTAGDLFGISVSISGDHALVGAEWAHESQYGSTGSACVFRRDGTMWKEIIELIPSPESYYDMRNPWFGSAVAVSGADVIVGASAAYPSGSAYTYSLIPISVNASTEIILVGGSVTLSWDCADATSVTIDNGIGSVPAQGSIIVSPSVTTSYSITATTALGSRTLSITIIVDTIAISITSPVNGNTILRPDTSVEGTIMNPLGLEVGVNVNGLVALVEGNRFVANHVPLEEAENIIIATAMTSEGGTASAQITLQADTASDYVRITADPESGIAPFETTLRIEASFSFSTSSLNHTGPGTVEVLSNATAGEYLVRMTVPGFYVFTAQVTDGQSNVHTDTTTILVMNQATLDGILRAKWNAMKSALIAGNKQRALAYHHEVLRHKYQTIYDLLGADLIGKVTQMQDIELIYATGDRAKYRIRRNHSVEGNNVTIAYYIYFSKNERGLWVIERY